MLRFSQNQWSTFLLRVLINTMQIIKHTFFKTEFLINNKLSLKNGNCYIRLDSIVHLGQWRNRF